MELLDFADEGLYSLNAFFFHLGFTF